MKFLSMFLLVFTIAAAGFSGPFVFSTFGGIAYGIWIVFCAIAGYAAGINAMRTIVGVK
jgi:hypothetical protein